MRDRRSDGFTLIELLAVMLILAMLAAIVIPGLSILGARPLRAQAENLASDLEFARVRSILLGVPHRVVIDLDGGAWRVEWLVTEAEALGKEVKTDGSAAGGGFDPRHRLDLSPPRGETPQYHPVPANVGTISVLEDELTFSRIDTSQGPVNRGTVAVGFERDGTADPVRIVLADSRGHVVAIEVQPLEEAVRVHDVER
ncbi:MAG TPA: GspH/FimT family pseudopilin [Myxococcota bacterium]|nr:GspH/FimT family pseudopilin [Myxococcota bacterium]